MTNRHTRFTFGPEVSMREVESTLKLAQLAAESVHGPDRVQIEGSWNLDHRQGSVTVETITDVGRTLAAVFLGYVRREFGHEAVQVTPGSATGTKAMAGVG